MLYVSDKNKKSIFAKHFFIVPVEKVNNKKTVLSIGLAFCQATETAGKFELVIEH